jgi:hypothetical protein
MSGNRYAIEPSVTKTLIYARYVAQANLEWPNTSSLLEEIKACYQHNPFLLEDLHSLKICPHCFELHGKINLNSDNTVKQQCLCVKRTENKWDGYDFKRKYETCYCCGLEVIPSGSKWSVFYCKDCKDKILELNKKVGQCVIPIGRHSIMNGFSLTGEQVQNESLVERFVCQVNKVNDKIGLIDNHRKKILARQLKFLKVSKGSKIIDLILQTHELELRQMKTEAFFELLALCTNMSVEEVKSLYDELKK